MEINPNSFSELNSLNDETINEITDRKNSLIKILDEEINIKKENFTSLFDKKEEIQKLCKKLDSNIKNLEEVISDLLDRQKDNYIKAFALFMDSIKKNLTKQLDEMEKAFEEKRKNNDIRVIQCERDFFKSEALRLNALCQKLKTDIEKINFNNKILKIELEDFKIKYKETDHIKKQILSEIENKIIENNKQNSLIGKKLKIKNDRNNNSKLKFNTENNINNSNSIIKKKLIKEINLDNEQVEKEKTIFDNSKNPDINILNSLLKKSKNETKKEKEKANKAIAELNNIYFERNKLEIIFQNCVEETKKIIFNRKMMENKLYKLKNKAGLFKFDTRVNFSTKFEEFLPSDKQSTLENFIFDDEVYNLVKDIIFKRTKKKPKNNISNNNINFNTNNNVKNNIKKVFPTSGTETKLKVLIDIPKNKFTKNTLSLLPLMQIKNINFANSNSPSLKEEQFHPKYRTITINKNNN